MGPIKENIQAIILSKKDVKQATSDMKKGVYILMENGMAKLTEDQQRDLKKIIGKW